MDKNGKTIQSGNPNKAGIADNTVETVCGFHAVGSAMRRASDDVRHIWVDRARRDQRLSRLILEAQDLGVTVSKVDRNELDRKGNGIKHQGVVAELRKREHGRGDLRSFLEGIQHDTLILVLDQVQDPHNLGACLRTAEGAGADAVILPKDRAVSVNATVRRVAAGAADRIPVFYVANLTRSLNLLKESGFWIYGAAEDGETLLFQTKFTGSCAIVMGAEGRGLRRLTRDGCDQILRIPMSGTVSSLNVSVATGVVLFEVIRQRRS